MRLDAHQHFWKLANGFSDWPTPDLLPIYRDFEPADIAKYLAECGIEGTILVQSAPSIEETESCLGLADCNPFIKGVVGWLDFETANALLQLGKLSTFPKLRGLRPMVQSIDEPGWLLKDKFTPIFEAMIENGLVLDGLVLPHQIGDLVEISRRHPELSVVLDHGGKPPIRNREFGIWSHDIARLAAFPNAYCKLSGLWTEAGDDHSQEVLRPWVNHLLASFGTARLIWGSDWPVVELKGSYGDWLAQCEAMLAHLTEEQRMAVFGNNGRLIYGID